MLVSRVSKNAYYYPFDVGTGNMINQALNAKVSSKVMSAVSEGFDKSPEGARIIGASIFADGEPLVNNAGLVSVTLRDLAS